MPPARPSRRSACNRCRDFKLRCDRLGAGVDSCDRCLKNGATCVTTLTGQDHHTDWIQTPSAPSHFRPPSRATLGASIAPSTASSPRGQQTDTPVSNASVGVTMSRGIPAGNSNTTLDSLTLDSGIDFNLAMAGFTYKGQPRADLEIHGSVGQLSPGTSAFPFADFAGLYDATDLFAGQVLEPEAQSNSSSNTHLRDLLELNIKLLDDCEAMKGDSSSPQNQMLMEAAIRGSLGNTSRFSDILKDFAVMDSPSSDEEGNSRHLGPQHSSQVGYQKHGVLMMTTLVTTYILLYQNWQRTLSQLHQFMLASSPEQIADLAPVLPTLQLGGFQVQASACIQISALLELVAGKLSTFDNYLGIEPSIRRRSSKNEVGQVRRLALSKDPMFISLREMLLSQEQPRSTNDASTAQRLGDMIDRMSEALVVHIKACKVSL
ncbi:hypothetical protein F4802DRAFT_602434 [Xylaria palmicola]|nr:hypothetical protein F4802DRAFT_602434 [Xylaria palmicola]